MIYTTWPKLLARTFFILDKTITPKFNNAAIIALAEHAPLACADADSSLTIPILDELCRPILKKRKDKNRIDI